MEVGRSLNQLTKDLGAEDLGNHRIRNTRRKGLKAYVLPVMKDTHLIMCVRINTSGP